MRSNHQKTQVSPMAAGGTIPFAGDPPIEFQEPVIIDHEPEIETKEPEIATPEPIAVQVRNAPLAWPKGVPMPKVYQRQLIPCPECKRLRLDGGSQAAVVTRSGVDVVYLRCKHCGNTWKMAAE